MTAASGAISSPPACSRHTIRPGLPPGGDADAGRGRSPLSVSRSGQSLAVTGEIDESSFCFFAEALDALAEGSLVHIDLAGVEYCDIAGLRLMCGSPGRTTLIAITGVRGAWFCTRRRRI
jgi:ABC-type transporter Mla MlaB component